MVLGRKIEQAIGFLLILISVVVSEERGFSFFGNSWFEPNMGQIGDMWGRVVKGVFFYGRGRGFDVYVGERGVSYVLRDVQENGYKFDVLDFESRMKEEGVLHRWGRIDLELVGGEVSVDRIEYEGVVEGYANYYYGHCPEGVLYVLGYRRVRIRDVYPGVNWVWEVREGGEIHHEFELEGADRLSLIRMRIRWADVELGDGGRYLVMGNEVGRIKDGEVVGYGEGGRVVGVRYVRFGEEIGYEL
ncbi:MAG: hypothetical protein ABDI07_11460, partial [Candidatus Kryptonium sp.]